MNAWHISCVVRGTTLSFMPSLSSNKFGFGRDMEVTSQLLHFQLERQQESLVTLFLL